MHYSLLLVKFLALSLNNDSHPIPKISLLAPSSLGLMSPNDYFQEVVDLHIVFRGKHKLSDILVVALGRYLSGGDNDESMYELG